MKFSARDLARHVAKPDPALAGLLIHGSDAMRVALKRKEVVAAMIGPKGEAEMRLDRMQGSDLRRDPAMLLDAVKAQGFFSGPRVVLIEDAGDGHADPFTSALSDWRAGDAQIVATAGALKASSRLRKLFETSRIAAAVAIYDDPPTEDEVRTICASAGLTAISPEAQRDIIALSRLLDPGDFRQTVEKLSLYMLGDARPVTSEDVAAIAPVSTEAAVDYLLAAVCDGQPARIGPLLARLQGQGVLPVTIAIMALRHFRTLHAVAAHPGGASAGIQAIRPPIFGPRRDRILSHAGQWGMARLERALTEIVATDLTLRSASNVPSMAFVERVLIRLAMLAQR